MSKRLGYDERNEHILSSHLCQPQIGTMFTSKVGSAEDSESVVRPMLGRKLLDAWELILGVGNPGITRVPIFLCRSFINFLFCPRDLAKTVTEIVVGRLRRMRLRVPLFFLVYFALFSYLLCLSI